MMIFDRTRNDVETAISLINNKVKKFLTLTNDEIAILEKGTLTINTINRIENKQSELKMLFNGMGYYGTPITSKTWEYSEIFDKENFERIINNTDLLKKAFFVNPSTPSIPKPIYHFSNINSLEKILYDLENKIPDITSRYRQCGTFECGEVNEN